MPVGIDNLLWSLYRGHIKFLFLILFASMPIYYSKCYGAFCATALKEPLLLTGFLAALEKMSVEISSDAEIESVKMGNTVMNFRKTLPTGHSVVVGLLKENNKVVEDIFKAVESLIEEKYKDKNWDYIDEDFADNFEKLLAQEVLNPAMHDHGGFADNCPAGSNCPMRTTAVQAKKGNVWSILRNTYTAIKTKMGM